MWRRYCSCDTRWLKRPHKDKDTIIYFRNSPFEPANSIWSILITVVSLARYATLPSLQIWNWTPSCAAQRQLAGADSAGYCDENCNCSRLAVQAAVTVGWPEDSCPHYPCILPCPAMARGGTAVSPALSNQPSSSPYELNMAGQQWNIIQRRHLESGIIHLISKLVTYDGQSASVLVTEVTWYHKMSSIATVLYLLLYCSSKNRMSLIFDAFRICYNKLNSICDLMGVS